jgi:hypothetical protein
MLPLHTTQVPDYKNDFVDFEVENWMTVSTPYLPTFLGFSALVLVGVLVIAAVAIVKRRKVDKASEETSPLWL